MPRKKENEVKVVGIRMVKEPSLYAAESVTTPEDVPRVVTDELSQYDREVFAILNLKTNGQPINLNICSVGTLSASMVSPREVFKSSILSNAAAFIAVHNHPSGSPQPSEEDIAATRRLQECGEVAGITNDAAAADGKTVTIVVEENTDHTLSIKSMKSGDTEISADSPLTFTNKVKTKDITVKKNWDSTFTDNEKGEVTIDLYRSDGSGTGSTYKSLQLDGTPDTDGEKTAWNGVFKGVPETDAKGQTYQYSVKEPTSDKYYSIVSGDADEGFTVTNKKLTATIPVQKKLTTITGEKAPDIKEKYTFKIAAADGSADNTPMPEEIEKKNPDSDGGTVNFGDITFTKAGTYEYKITESGEVAGITNDAAASDGKTVTIVVEENTDHTLSIKSMKSGDTAISSDSPLTFTNKVQTKDLTAHLQWRNADGTTENDYKKPTVYLKLYRIASGGKTAARYHTAATTRALPASAEPVPGAALREMPDGKLETSWSGLRAVDSAGRAYRFYVQEVDAQGNDLTPSGYTKEEEGLTVTLTRTAVKAQIPVKKVLTTELEDNKNLPDISGKFTFSIAAAEDSAADTPLPSETEQPNPDSDGGTVNFSDITFTKAGTYKYRITESGEVDGITNDADAASGKTVEVKIVKDDTGALQIENVTSTEDEPLTFTNTVKKSDNSTPGDKNQPGKKKGGGTSNGGSTPTASGGLFSTGDDRLGPLGYLFLALAAGLIMTASIRRGKRGRSK
ncbi:MAG: Spy0128 family protein [Anaerovoracaceae bacterium]|jgi:DNA repair protein RadC